MKPHKQTLQMKSSHKSPRKNKAPEKERPAEAVPHAHQLLPLKKRFLEAFKAELSRHLKSAPPFDQLPLWQGLVPNNGCETGIARMFLTALESDFHTFLSFDAEQWKVLALKHGFNPPIYHLVSAAESGSSAACGVLAEVAIDLVDVLNRIARDHPEWLTAKTRKLNCWPILDSPLATFRFPQHKRTNRKGCSSLDDLYEALQLGVEFWIPINKTSRASFNDPLGRVVLERLYMAEIVRMQARADERASKLITEDRVNRKIVPLPYKHSVFEGLTHHEESALKSACVHFDSMTTPSTFLQFPNGIPAAIAAKFGVQGWLKKIALLVASRLPILSKDSSFRWATAVKVLLLAEFPSKQLLESSFKHLVKAPSHQRNLAGRFLEDVEERIVGLPLNPDSDGMIS